MSAGPMLTPESVSSLQEIVRAHPRLRAAGAGSKPRVAAEGDAPRVSLRGLSGLVEYTASEYTFTARAGTPVAEVEAALAAKGQYLPFDPPRRLAGATLGGTVACGLSGPGRFRYGGVRDFLLEARFVDGRGTLVRGGARVVKNAAGFDLPKLLCGSLGRLGLLVELTFKVFPRPPAETTLAIACPSAAEAVAVMARAANSRWEPDALDYNPAAGAVWLRLAHAPATLDALAAEIAALWPGRVTRLDPAAAAAAWQGVTEWEESTLGAAVAKVPLTPARIPEFDAAFAHAPGVRIHYSVGGNLAWLGWNGPVPGALDATLRTLRLPGLLLRGEGPLHLGAQPARAIDAAITRAVDPDGRFA